MIILSHTNIFWPSKFKAVLPLTVAVLVSILCQGEIAWSDGLAKVIASPSVCQNQNLQGCSIAELKAASSSHSSIEVIKVGQVDTIADYKSNIFSEDVLTRAGVELLSSLSPAQISSMYNGKLMGLSWIEGQAQKDAMTAIIKDGQAINALPASDDPQFKDLKFVLSYGAAIQVANDKGSTEWMGFFDYGRNTGVPGLAGSENNPKNVLDEPLPAFTPFKGKNITLKPGVYKVRQLLDLISASNKNWPDIAVSKQLKEDSVYVQGATYDTMELFDSTLSSLNLELRNIKDTYFISPRKEGVAIERLAKRVLGRYQLPAAVPFLSQDFESTKSFDWDKLNEDQVQFTQKLLKTSGYSDYIPTTKPAGETTVSIRNSFWVQFIFVDNKGRMHEYSSQIF